MWFFTFGDQFLKIKMKRVFINSLQSSPEEARIRQRHQCLLQDYLELQKVRAFFFWKKNNAEFCDFCIGFCFLLLIFIGRVMWIYCHYILLCSVIFFFLKEKKNRLKIMIFAYVDLAFFWLWLWFYPEVSWSKDQIFILFYFTFFHMINVLGIISYQNLKNFSLIIHSCLYIEIWG